MCTRVRCLDLRHNYPLFVRLSVLRRRQGHVAAVTFPLFPHYVHCVCSIVLSPGRQTDRPTGRQIADAPPPNLLPPAFALLSRSLSGVNYRCLIKCRLRSTWGRDKQHFRRLCTDPSDVATLSDQAILSSRGKKFLPLATCVNHYHQLRCVGCGSLALEVHDWQPPSRPGARPVL